MLSILLFPPRSHRHLVAAHAAMRRALLRASAWAFIAEARVADGRPQPVLAAALDGLADAGATLRAARCRLLDAELGVCHAE